MESAILYVALFGVAGLFIGAEYLIHRFWKNKEFIIVERVLIFLLIAVFTARYLSAEDFAANSENIDVVGLFGGPMDNGFLNFVGFISIWLELTGIVFLFLRPFTPLKTTKWYAKFLSTPLILFASICYFPMVYVLQGNGEITFRSISLAIELGLSLAICAFYWAKDYKFKVSKHSYGEVASIAVLSNVFTIPIYMPAYLFGQGEWMIPYDMTIYHRVLVYLAVIIIPVVIYFAFRKCSIDKRWYVMRFISIATMITYFSYTKGVYLLCPWKWPFHLCCLAMVLVFLCYTFKLKKLFYFTYFINVFGALMAMLMPNYGELDTIFLPNVMHFWMNHCCAFMMPLLGVALKLYDRPKLKQYGYSVIAFLGYFLLVFVLNTIFAGFELKTVTLFGQKVVIRDPNFFFINDDFIAKKLGSWASKLVDLGVEFNVGDVTFTIRPAYQSIFFATYVVIGLGMWFIYQIFFDIADSHQDLHMRLKGIRADKLALESALEGRKFDEPMKKNEGIELELEHFSKKYAMSPVYAVDDASFVVHGGEVFGFLGPNGAGKSTIIKSIVGIQPITQGKIYVCGYDVKLQPVFAKNIIGFVPDHYALYEKLTGREYLNYIADIYEVSQEDRDNRLKEYIHLFDLESSIDNKIKTYSHGMKQKITIISALVHEPKVWILDEPLTGLDPNSIYQVKECMKKHAAKGNIVFFSSHLIDIVEKLCDRIAIIKKGHIQCITDVNEIEKTGKSLEDFYMSVINKQEENKEEKNEQN